MGPSSRTIDMHEGSDELFRAETLHAVSALQASTDPMKNRDVRSQVVVADHVAALDARELPRHVFRYRRPDGQQRLLPMARRCLLVVFMATEPWRPSGLFGGEIEEEQSPIAVGGSLQADERSAAQSFRSRTDLTLNRGRGGTSAAGRWRHVTAFQSNEAVCRRGKRSLAIERKKRRVGAAHRLAVLEEDLQGAEDWNCGGSHHRPSN